MGKHVKDGPEAKAREALADLHRSIYLLYEAADMYGDRGDHRKADACRSAMESLVSVWDHVDDRMSPMVGRDD